PQWLRNELDSDPADNAQGSWLKAGARLHNLGSVILNVMMKMENTNKRFILIIPSLWLNGEWKNIYDGQTFFDEHGKALTGTPQDLSHISTKTVQIIQCWARQTRFFDTVRALDRSSGRMQMDDGSRLLEELHKWHDDGQRVYQWQKFNHAFLSVLNKIVVPTGIPKVESVRLARASDGTNKPTMYLVFANAPSLPVNIFNMGSGVAELVLVTAALVQDENKQMEYFIEEPETHLHPSLLRRYVSELSAYGNIQYFLTTHSNAVLDSLGPADTIYHVSHTTNSGCRAMRVKTLIEHHNILDDLGVSGSTLLQANCVIWVEGPSDRLYVRTWLHAAAAEQDIDIKEGSDYCFAFYGGKLLTAR
ncbi:MAG: AAA family ATPase, partial [Patescibacteria group bacterium]